MTFDTDIEALRAHVTPYASNLSMRDQYIPQNIKRHTAMHPVTIKARHARSAERRKYNFDSVHGATVLQNC